MSALERYWLAPIPAVRPWLFFKATLLLFGLDTFREHLRPAWRYGAAGFNVAHFAILDALPIPSSAFYVGTMIAIGLASFVCALAPRPRRPLIAFVALAYLWSWSCSMHDSYQHHYLLSLFFLAFAFFPLLSARDLFGVPGDLGAKPATDAPEAPRKGAKQPGRAARVAKAPSAPPELDAALPHGLVPRASAWAMVVVWTTAAIVYTYTAVSKTEDDWIRGDALRNITADGRDIPGAVELFAALGIEGDALWPFLGHSVIALQIGLAIGYATAPLRDRAWPRAVEIALEIIAWTALFLALSFHLGAEYMGLEIGWFSWYMILLALATFVPARALGYLVLFASWPLRALSERMQASESPIGTALLAAVAGAVLLPAGTMADLPGALPVCVLAGVALMAAAVIALVRKEGFGEVRAAALAALLGALGMIAMLRMEPDVRYDYWRFAGGDFRRRGEWALALAAYQHANRYAPEGQSRARQIDEMRERIRVEGPRRAPR